MGMSQICPHPAESSDITMACALPCSVPGQGEEEGKERSLPLQNYHVGEHMDKQTEENPVNKQLCSGTFSGLEAGRAAEVRKGFQEQVGRKTWPGRWKGGRILSKMLGDGTGPESTG